MGDGEIRTRDRLVIKALIPCQNTNSTWKLKFLSEVSKYNLYYFLTETTANSLRNELIDHLEDNLVNLNLEKDVW